MNTEAIGCLIVISIMTIANIIIGLIIKRKKVVDIISGYDEKLDNKEFIAELFGNHMIILGVIEIITSLVYVAVVILKPSKSVIEYYVFGNAIMVILVCAKIYYRMSKARKNNM